MRKNSAEMRKIEGKFCGKNIGMYMSLFLYGNSAEMRETAWGKFCGEKTEAWKWDYFCMEFCGNEGNWGKIMYSSIFIYVSLIGNGTWKNVCQQIQAIIEISWGGGGGIIFHGLEYLIRREVFTIVFFLHFHCS